MRISRISPTACGCDGHSAQARRHSILVAIGFGVGFATNGAAGQTANAEPRTTALRIAQATQTLSLPAPNVGSQRLTVEIADWRFAPGKTEMDMPSGGATVIAVTNGSVSASIGGDTRTYDTGEYWSVPAGTKMTVTIKPPTRGAILRTITGSPAS